MMTTKRFTLLAVLAGALSTTPAAVAEGWLSELGDAKAVPFGEVVRNPRDFIDVPVKMTVVFHKVGSAYNPWFTRFISDVYVNFSVWPENARLYEKRDFERAYPYFYAQKFNPVSKVVRDLDRVTPVEVVAVVRDVFRGEPLVEVLSVRKVKGLREEDVRNVVAGDACFLAGRHKEAGRRYAAAADRAVVPVVRADLHRRAGDAYYAAGDFDEALSHYEDGVSVAPESVVLKRGVEAAREADRLHRKSKKGAVVSVSVVPAPRSEPVVADMANDVDLYIAHFEDPAVVAAEVAAHQASLERRAAAVRASREATVAVAPVVESTDESGKAAAVVEEPVVVEPVVEEPVVEEPVVEEPVVEQPVVEQPVVEEPVVEQPVVEQPVVEQPVVEEPAVEQPVVEEPAVQEPVVEQPVVEQPVVEQPAVEQPVVPEPVVEQPVVEQPAVEQPVVEQPAVEQPVVEEPVVEQPAESVQEGCAPCGEGSVVEGCGVEKQPAVEGCESAVEPVEGVTEVPAVVEGEPVVEGSVEEPAVAVAPVVRLPRLPFFGCDGVTAEQLRAVLEEIAAHPEEE